MFSIYLNKVVLENFKGIKKFEKTFEKKENLIQARFGSGKTSIKQSLNFVLGLKVENYRPYLVENGVWVENENAGTTNVEWEIEVDDTIVPVNYKFQIKDTGKTISYFIDEIKYPSKKAYQSKVLEILQLVNVEQLETVMNLDYFLNLKWNEQREILKRITGVNTVLKEVQLKEEFALLNQQYFCKNVSELDVKKSLKQRRKSLEQEKALNESLIANDKQIIESLKEVYFDDIKNELEKIENEIRKLDDVSKQAKISDLKLKLVEARELHRQEIAEMEKVLNTYYLEKNKTLNMINTCNSNLELCYNDLEVNKQIKKEVEEKEFDAKTLVCPTCGSSISAEKLREKFILNKKNEILKCEDKINSLLITIQENQKILDAQQNSLKLIDEKINKELSSKERLEEEFMIKADAIEIEIFELEQTNNTIEIQKLRSAKDDLIKQLANEEILIRAKVHLEETTNLQIGIVKKEQELIQLEELLNEYLLETQSIFANHINSYFQEEIRWQFFSKLVSTGETTEDCILLCKGKRYDTACSTGERLMAKVLVVQGLQKIINLNLPIFVDDFNDLGIKFKAKQQLILLETKSNVELESIERY